MKKFIDRYLFSRVGLQIVISVLFIVLFSLLANVGMSLVTGKSITNFSQGFLGFCQAADGGCVAETISGLDSMQDRPVSAAMVLIIALVTWFVGMCICSFVTGAIVNAFQERRDRIRLGLIRYQFEGHGVIVGWSFQGVASVMAMFDLYGMREVVILSEHPSDGIRDELAKEFDAAGMRKIFVYNGSVGVKADVEHLCCSQARIIMVLGDAADGNHDGLNMRTSRILRDAVRSDLVQWKKIDGFLTDKRKSRMRKMLYPPSGSHGIRMRIAEWLFKRENARIAARMPNVPIEMFIDISHGYSLMPCEVFPTDGVVQLPYLHVTIINFFKATARELYSSFAQMQEWNSGRRNGVFETDYRPLMFRRNPESSHVHLIFSGVDEMARALMLHLVPIMPVGSFPNRITVFADDEKAVNDFRSAYPLDQLLNTEFEFIDSCITDISSRKRLAEIVKDVSASVTIFLTGENADDVISEAHRLPRDIHYENFVLMLEQRILSKWVRKLLPLKRLGFLKVDAFGFTDRYYTSIGKTLQVSERLFGPKAAQKDQKQAEDRVPLLKGFVHHKGRNCYYNDGFVDGLLERCYAHGYKFAYNRDAEASLTVVDDKIMHLMVRDEHIRNVNFRLLSGQSAGSITDTERNVCADIVLWKDVTEKQKELYKKWIGASFNAIAEVFNCGEYPYIVKQTKIDYILGVIPAEISSCDYREINALRLKVCNDVLDEAWRFTRVTTPDGNTKDHVCFAILVIPEEGLAFETYRINMTPYPMIAVLPESPELYARRFKRDAEREAFWQWMRQMQDYCVLVGATRSEMIDFIRSHSNLLLELGEGSSEIISQGRWHEASIGLITPRKVSKMFRLSGSGVDWNVGVKEI